MDYATHYDVGDRKRDDGINEDSVAVSVFADGAARLRAGRLCVAAQSSSS